MDFGKVLVGECSVIAKGDDREVIEGTALLFTFDSNLLMMY